MGRYRELIDLFDSGIDVVRNAECCHYVYAPRRAEIAKRPEVRRTHFLLEGGTRPLMRRYVTMLP